MPPAEKATIARIGLVGQACAHASPFAQARARSDSNIKQTRVMPFSLVSRRALRGRYATGQQPGRLPSEGWHMAGRQKIAALRDFNPANVSCGSILLQKSFCTGDQKFSGP